MRPLISIVIPFFNLGPMTVQCLRSVEEHTKIPYELILVDNGSDFPDFLVVQKFLENRKIPYKLVRLESNLGFIYGTNAGIAEASGKYIILLNNDTMVSKNWEEYLIRPLQGDSEFGIIGPISESKVGWQHAQKINQIYELGVPPYRKALCYDIYATELQEKFGGKVFELRQDPLSFFCAAIKREVFEKIGLLNTDFGMGIGDDDEFCLRARRAGYKIGLALGAFVAHRHRTTFNAMQLSVPALRMANLEKLRNA